MSTDRLKAHPKWNRDQFLTFLLLYASMADMQYSDQEREYILSRVEPDTLQEVKKEFDQCKDFECLQIIEAYRARYLDTPDKKSVFLTRIEELFQSDGEYSITENNLFLMLRKLL